MFPLLIENGRDIERNVSLASDIFDDMDCYQWMKSERNLQKLSDDNNKKNLWKGIKMWFRSVSGQRDGNATPTSISAWMNLSEKEQALYGLTDRKKCILSLKKRMPKGHEAYGSISRMNESALKEFLIQFPKESKKLILMCSCRRVL